MKEIALTFCMILFLFFATSLADASAQTNNTEEDQKVKEQSAQVKISQEELLGTWKCTRYVLGGMEQEFMAKRLPEVIFREDKVTYMMQDYDYKIKDGKIILTSGREPVDATPFEYDGQFLVQVGDNAKVYYKKKD